MLLLDACFSWSFLKWLKLGKIVKRECKLKSEYFLTIWMDELNFPVVNSCIHGVHSYVSVDFV